MIFFKKKDKIRVKPYQTVGNLFWSAYESKKQIDNITNYIVSELSCKIIIVPSKELLRKYGLRGKQEYWIIWAAVEEYVKNKLKEYAQPEQ